MARGRKKAANRLRQIGEFESSAVSRPPSFDKPSDGQLVELGMFISTTVLGTIVLVVLAIVFGVKSIESHLETTITQQLTAAGIKDVTVDATGTDIRLRGTVAEDEQLATVPEFVAEIEGVSSVAADLAVVVVSDPGAVTVVADPLTISWDSGSATVSGEVSSETTRSAIVTKLQERFPAGVTADDLVVLEGAPGESDWLSRILRLVDIGADSLSTGEIFVNPGAQLVQVTGEFETRQERADARDEIEQVVAETPFDFTSALSIPEAPAFTPQQVVELQQNLDDLIADKVVEFELNSDVLTPIGKALLDEILDALVQFPNVPIEIGGHTDSQGDDAANLDLSERRARAALDYLVAHGQDPERFVVHGYGETMPVASNDTAEGRARNRRIEFKALEE